MKSFKKINLDDISCIESFLDATRLHITWRPARKFFRLLDLPEGFYYRDKIFTKEQIENGEFDGKKYFVNENNIVCYKPHIEITMRNGEKIEKYFESAAELFQYMDSSELNKIKWVEIK